MTLTLYNLFLIVAASALVLTAIRYFMRRPSNLLITYLQNFVGAFFIFSGFVKAIDPLGTSYKIAEYFTEFGMGFLEPFTLSFSVVTIVLEIVLGVTLLLGYLKEITVWLLLLLIVFFTFLTGYTTVTGNVTDCGCFGDFLKIEPFMSFMKDIVLSVMILILFFGRRKIEAPFSRLISAPLTVIATIIFTLFCFRNFAWNLPLYDFRPYKIGNYLPELMKEVPDKVEYLWVYKIRATGEQKEFTDAEFKIISNEPDFREKYEFVDRKIGRMIEKGTPAKINNFQIVSQNGDDLSEDILYNPDYQLLVIAYDLDKTCEKAFLEKLNPMSEAADKAGMMFFAVTAATPKKAETFRHENQTTYPFHSADPIFLKTIIRSNPGLLLLKDGKVIGKWHHRHIPSFDDLKANYLK